MVGVHTPEFAFEHVQSNVARAVRSYGIDYPVALDNDYGTWTAWGNQYWPAEYYVDRQGDVRYAHFRRGRLREDGERHPHALRGEAPARRGVGLDPGPYADRGAHSRDVPRHGPPRPVRRLAAPRGA